MSLSKPPYLRFVTEKQKTEQGLWVSDFENMY